MVSGEDPTTAGRSLSKPFTTDHSPLTTRARQAQREGASPFRATGDLYAPAVSLQDRARAFQGLAFDANLTVTKVLGERVFGQRSSIVDTVPAGVNLSHFRPGLSRDARQELSIPADAVVFVHAGVVEAERATDVVLRAFAHALEEDGRLWLLMPGKGRQLEDLRRLAQHLDVAKRVWLPGYIPYPALPRIFTAADAYVWVKPPGESDGTCRPGEPPAGQWWTAYALGLAQRAAY